MAERHWVGGTGDWDATAGTKWSLTNGGAGGEAVPTSADDVYFDSGSGNGTCTIPASSGNVCRNIDLTGFTGTLEMVISSSLTISGNAIFNTHLVCTGGTVTFDSTTNSTLTTNGATLNSLGFQTHETTGLITLQDDLTSISFITLLRGGFDTNSKNVTCTYFDSNTTTYLRSLTLGTTIFTVSRAGNSCFRLNATKLTFSGADSTIKCVANASNYSLFYGAGKTFGTIWNAMTGTGYFGVALMNGGTVSCFKSEIGREWRFALTTALTLADASGWQMTGSSGNLVKVKNTTDGSKITINCTTGDVVCDYVSFQDMVGAGGADFYAGTHSTNVSGNSGWLFEDPPASGAKTFTGVGSVTGLSTITF